MLRYVAKTVYLLLKIHHALYTVPDHDSKLRCAANP